MTSEPPRSGDHPFTVLMPDVVLDALATVGLLGDGRLLALNSYENRVYQVHLDRPHAGHEVVVAKFYRPQRWERAQILEEHAFAAELTEAEFPMVAPLSVNGQTLHEHAGFSFSVSPRRGGRAPNLDDDEVLAWLGRLLARLHTVGAARPFGVRPALDLATHGREPRERLLALDAIAPEVRTEWLDLHSQCLDTIARVAPALAQGPTAAGDGLRWLRTHADCHPGNILWHEDDGPHFVDLDDARTCLAVQDFWMLLSGSRAQQTRALATLVDAYEQLRGFDLRELALIEPLRTLRLIHYSAWLAARWDDPSFRQSFPWFGSHVYWQGQCDQLREQLEAMDEDPLRV